MPKTEKIINRKDNHLMMAQENHRIYGKVALVFGGASGIGKKITEIFAQEGATVILLDLDSQNGEKLSKDLRKDGCNVYFCCVDITNEAMIKDTVARMIKEHKRIDILINNVRGNRDRPKSHFESSLKDWVSGFSFLLGGAYVTLKYILPQMVEQKSGVVLNMGSVSGFMIGDEPLNYHVAKAGLIQLTKYVADKYGRDGIRANCISPGFIVRDEDLSRFNKGDNWRYKQTALQAHPLRKVGSALDVANAALFLCSEESSFITGENLIVDGGLTLRDQWSVAYQINSEESNRDRDERAKPPLD